MDFETLLYPAVSSIMSGVIIVLFGAFWSRKLEQDRSIWKRQLETDREIVSELKEIKAFLTRHEIQFGVQGERMANFAERLAKIERTVTNSRG